MAKKYNFMILDNTDNNKKKPYYGRACNPKIIPTSLRSGLKKIWALNDKYYDNKYMARGKLDTKGSPDDIQFKLT